MTDPTPPENDPGLAADPLSVQAGIAPEVSRRVSSILDAVEREATQLRAEAREEARRYLEFSRRRADNLVTERQRRIAELSDEIMAKAEAVVGRLDDAAPVRAGFENLVRALGDAAERLARESEATSHEFEPPSFHDEAIAYEQGLAAPQPQPQPPAPELPETYGSPYSAPGAQPETAPPPPSPAHAPVAPGQAPQPQAPRPTQPQHAPQPPQAPGIPAGAGVPAGPNAPRPPYPPPAQPPAPPAPAAAAGAGDAWQNVDDARLIGIQMAAAGRTRGQVREHLHNQLGLGETRSILDEIYGPGSPEDARVPWTAFPS